VIDAEPVIGFRQQAQERRPVARCSKHVRSFAIRTAAKGVLIVEERPRDVSSEDLLHGDAPGPQACWNGGPGPEQLVARG